MIFCKRKNPEKQTIRWENELIERVNSHAHVYLGVPFTEELDFQYTKIFFVKKSEQAHTDLQLLIFSSKMNEFST